MNERGFIDRDDKSESDLYMGDECDRHLGGGSRCACVEDCRHR